MEEKRAEQGIEQGMEQEICDRAGEYFGNGYHCAEAVVAAVLAGMGQEASMAIAHATAFGGGFGKTYEETCGALSGAMIVIGHLHGRRELGDNWEVPAELAAAIRQMFMDRFDTTHCRSLREAFGDEAQMDQCRNIVRHVTCDLVALLEISPRPLRVSER